MSLGGFTTTLGLGQLIACRNQGKGCASSGMAFMSGGIGSFLCIASFQSVINSHLATSIFCVVMSLHTAMVIIPLISL